MPREESHYPQDWFRIGDKEPKRAQNLLNLGDLEGSGFNIQQALEKYLKGYLLSKGWELKRAHNLEALLNETIIYDSSFEEFRAACQKITQYYVVERYPLMVSSELTQDEIEESLTIAERIVEKIKRLVLMS
jgi:HEPN domain-containing protein